MWTRTKGHLMNLETVKQLRDLCKEWIEEKLSLCPKTRHTKPCSLDAKLFNLIGLRQCFDCGLPMNAPAREEKPETVAAAPFSNGGADQDEKYLVLMLKTLWKQNAAQCNTKNRRAMLTAKAVLEWLDEHGWRSQFSADLRGDCLALLHKLEGYSSGNDCPLCSTAPEEMHSRECPLPGLMVRLETGIGKEDLPTGVSQEVRGIEWPEQIPALAHVLSDDYNSDAGTWESVAEAAFDWFKERGAFIAELAPIPMILYCPNCGTQHIDAPEPDTGWTNPPHRSHKCHACQSIWRPADVHTVGVAGTKTRGEHDIILPGRIRHLERGYTLEGFLKKFGAEDQTETSESRKRIEDMQASYMKQVQPQIDALRDAGRVTAADLSVHINSPEQA
jgi:hypothetical protein